jgi:integrase
MTRGVKVRDDGEGSVYEEGGKGSGLWRAALVIDGKIVRRRAPTEKGAKLKLKELERMREARLNVGDGKQTLKTWATFWLTTILPNKKGQGGGKVKPKTIQGHTEVVNLYILAHLGRHQLIRLTAQHIDEWQGTLREKGLSDGTIASARKRLSSILEAARKRKLVPENVVKLTEAPGDAPRRRTAGKDVLDEGQIVTLLELFDAEQHRLYPLYMLAATTGIRQAELIGLRWGALDLVAGTLTVREQLQRIKDKDGKSQIHREDSTKGGKDRLIYLDAEQIAILRTHQPRQRQEKLILGDAYKGEDLVFTSEDGTPILPTALRAQFRRALVRAKLPIVTFHSLRHSAGSVMLAHGAQLVSVSHVLGHASPAITARIYAHSFEDGRRQAVAAAARALLRSA